MTSCFNLRTKKTPKRVYSDRKGIPLRGSKLKVQRGFTLTRKEFLCQRGSKLLFLIIFFTLEVDANCKQDKNENSRVASLESVSVHLFIILEKRRIKISDKTFF